MTTFLSDIILAGANDIQFKNTSGANTGKIESDGNNLVLSNARSEEHTSELQSPVPTSYAVFCLKKTKIR